jgi:hypothetical protein
MNLTMEQSILVNGRKMDLGMEKVSKFGQMGQSMRGIGRVIWLMEKED